MKMSRSLFITSICFLSVIGSVSAANKKVGTSGAQFLRIGAGARPTAMGDAFVGVADDVNAVYYNPAGLAKLQSSEFTAMHMQYIQDMNYDYGAFAFPTHIGSFGFSAATLKINDLDRRNSDESYQGSFDNLDAAYALSYGRTITSSFSLGATVRYVQQQIDSTKATALTGDVGVFHRSENSPLTWGLALRHFGQSIRFQEESDPLPFIIDAGAGYSFFSKRLLLSGDIKQPRDNGLQFGIGSEWKSTLAQNYAYALRAGYNSTGTDADGTTGVSLGGGLGYRQFTFDFAWVPFGDLGNTFRYAAHFRF